MSEAKNNYAGGEKIASDDLNQISQNANDGGGFRDLIMGDAFTGTATPQASYQSASDNKLYICDGNDADKLNFLGFVLNTGSADDTADLQTEGIVRGFTGLVEGSYYYVQDDKTIGTSVGTYAVLVGIAISETELQIIKPASYDNTFEEAIVSDSLKASADTTRNKANSMDFTKVKEIEVRVGGNYRVKFDLRSYDNIGGGNSNGNARIYKNGVAYGTDRNTTSNIFATFSEDLAFVTGDLIQLYYKNYSLNDDLVEVKNFRIYNDLVIKGKIEVITD